MPQNDPGPVGGVGQLPQIDPGPVGGAGQLPPIDLVAVGGTGQWFAVQLLSMANPPVNVRRCYIVDPDNDTIDEGKPAYHLVQLAQHRRTQLIWESPHIPHGITAVADYLQPDSILRVALSPFERGTAVNEGGFHAVPRLAATWSAQWRFGEHRGDLQRFNDAHAGDPTPVVVAGSVAGGTGAGLLPYVMRASRRMGPPWHAPIVFCAFLPWLNPELEQGAAEAGGAIRWTTLCHNAALAFDAVSEKFLEIHRRANAWGGVLPPTRLLVLGPDPEVARDTAPSAIDELIRAGAAVLHPALYGAADALAHLVSWDDRQAPPPASTHVLPSQAYLRPLEGRGELAAVIAAKQCTVIASLDLGKAVGFGGIPRTGGLGHVLGQLVLAASLAPGSARAQFFAAFNRTLRAYAQAYGDVQLPPEVPHSCIEDVDAIIHGLDVLAEVEGARIEQLVAAADCRGDATSRAQACVGALWGALVSLASRVYGGDQHDRIADVRRAWGVTTGAGLPMLPRAVRNALGPQLAMSSSDPAFLNTLRRALRDVYFEQANLGQVFVARASATPLSSAHVLAQSHVFSPAGTQLPALVADRVRTLWRAFVLGVLDLRGVDPAEVEWLDRIESLSRFGDNTVHLLYFADEPLGFHSVDVGLVPTAEVLEYVDEAPPVPRSWAALERTLAPYADELDAALIAFARAVTGALQGAGAQNEHEPPWLYFLNHYVVAESSPLARDLAGRIDLRERTLVAPLTLRAPRRVGQQALDQQFERLAVPRLVTGLPAHWHDQQDEVHAQVHLPAWLGRSDAVQFWRNATARQADVPCLVAAQNHAAWDTLLFHPLPSLKPRPLLECQRVDDGNFVVRRIHPDHVKLALAAMPRQPIA